MARWLAMLVACVLGAGCGRDAPPAADAEPALRVEAQDPETGVGVAVSVDRAEVRTVDRVEVEIIVTRPAGMPATVTEPDWAAADWEVVESIGPRSRALADGRIEEWRGVTLEPFLDGSYAVPPVVVAAGGRSVATGSLEVAVRSVLDAEDTGELAGPAGVVGPPESEPVRTGLVIAAVAVGLGVVIVLWRLTREPGGDGGEAELAPVEALRRVAEGRADASDELGVVHRAVDRLAADAGVAGSAGGPGRWRAVLDRLERARFDPRGDDATGEAARAIARDALAMAEGRA